jgi:hypothetical protein
LIKETKSQFSILKETYVNHIEDKLKSGTKLKAKKEKNHEK